MLAAAPVLGCKVLPPPPVVPFHDTTAAAPKGETSVVVVIGLVSQALGGAGLGAAVRVQRQETDRTLLGAELAVGRGDADADTIWLFALRGYGKLTPRTHDWAALHYGAGISVLSTGMTTLTAHTAGQVSWINDYWEPYLGAGIALAVPVIDGRPFGNMPRDDEPDPPEHVLLPHQPPAPLRTRLYLTVVPGFAVPVSDGHLLSLDLGLAASTGGGFYALSAADRVR